MRRLAKFLGVLLAAVVFWSGTSGARAQFGGNLTVAGVTLAAVDTDGSGLYDALFVNITADVSTVGDFEFGATLYVPDPSHSYTIGSGNGTDLNLSVGRHVVSILLSAEAIGLLRTDGPYSVNVRVDALDETALRSEYGQDLATPAWTAAQFDGPAVQLIGPVTDEGRDVHGEGLFDQLVVHVPIRVVRTAQVALTGTLQYGWLFEQADLQPYRTYLPGMYTLDAVFDGPPIRAAEQNGPYHVYLRVSPATSWLNSTLYHTTAAYSFDEFAGPSADFRGPPTLTPVDLDGSGKADVLRAHVPLHVRVGGNYSMTADFGCWSNCTSYASVSVSRIVRLDAGDPTEDLDLSGTDLSRAPAGGDYFADIQVASVDDPSLNWNRTIIDYGPLDTSAFDAKPIADVTVVVNGLVPGAACTVAFAIDPEAHYFASYDSPMDAPPHLSLYNGTFDLLVAPCSEWNRSVVQRITVSGSTQVTADLPPSPRLSVDGVVSMSSWDRGTLDMAYDWGSESPYIRFFADSIGNLDGVADNQELARTGGLLFASPYVYYPYTGGFRVAVDRVPFYTTWAGEFNSAGAGPLTATESAITSVRFDLTALQPIGTGSNHTLTVDVPYSNDGIEYGIHVRLPSEADGNATLSTHLTLNYEGFDLPGNGTLTKTSAGAWEVTVGQDPGPSHYYTHARLTIGSFPRAPAGPSTFVLVGVLAAAAAVPLVVAVLLLVRRGRRKVRSDQPR